MNKTLLYLKKILFIITSFTVTSFGAQTTYDFTSGLSFYSTSGWTNNMAKFTVDGVEYTINGGINGSLSNPTTGGAANSKCLKKSTAGGDTFTLTRTDGKTFQFYGLWTKHNSMNSYASLGVSLPPFYTITATDDCETRASYTDNTAMQGGSYTTSSYNWAISGGVTVKSVQISFKATDTWWVDDIILGPALNNFTPNLTTGNATNITSTSATLSGSITNSDNSSDWGFVWSMVNTIPEYGQTNTTSVSATTTGNFSNNITFTGVAAGTTIYYRSFSDNWMCGMTEYGDVRSFVLQGTLATNENQNKKSIQLIPNPAKNFVTLSNISKGAEVSVFDMTGKILFKTKSSENSLTINTSAYLLF